MLVCRVCGGVGKSIGPGFMAMNCVRCDGTGYTKVRESELEQVKKKRAKAVKKADSGLTPVREDLGESQDV